MPETSASKNPAAFFFDFGKFLKQNQAVFSVQAAPSVLLGIFRGKPAFRAQLPLEVSSQVIELGERRVFWECVRGVGKAISLDKIAHFPAEGFQFGSEMKFEIH